MAQQVFVCHSSRDKAVADAACAALEAKGIACWIAPRDVLAGMEYGAAIMEALTACKVVLVIFSRHADESPQVRREIERAVSKDKVLLPFRIEDVLPSGAMEYALGNTHWLDAFAPPMERHLAELCGTVSRLLEQRQTGPGVKEDAVAHGPVQPGRGKGWIWGGGLAVMLALALVSFVVARPREVGVRDGASVSTTATTGIAVKPVQRAPIQDVSGMEAEAERFYRDKDFAAAFPLAKGACDGGDAAGCNYEAAMYLMGVGVAKDEAQAVMLYRKACDGGKAAGCSNLAAMYQNGKGIGQDDGRAVVYYGKACEGGYAIGCTAVGEIYEKGRGVVKDLGQAVTFYGKGCDGGYGLGCADLGAMYFDGRGVPQDQGQAMRLYRRACEVKYEPACEFLKAHAG